MRKVFWSTCLRKDLVHLLSFLDPRSEWTPWLGNDLLAPVPHRQMVFTVRKRLRPYFLWRRKLLSDLARLAAWTATVLVHSTLDEPELSVGIVLSIQTHGSLLNCVKGRATVTAPFTSSPTLW